MKTYHKEIKWRTFEFALSALWGCRKIAQTEKEFIVTRQLARSATSVGANVREARNAVSKKISLTRWQLHRKNAEACIGLSCIRAKATPEWRKR